MYCCLCMTSRFLAPFLFFRQTSRKPGQCEKQRSQETERKWDEIIIGLSPMVCRTQERAYPPRGLTLDYRLPCPPRQPALCFNELYGKGGICNLARHMVTYSNDRKSHWELKKKALGSDYDKTILQPRDKQILQNFLYFFNTQHTV
jgi:hypothetical protein